MVVKLNGKVLKSINDGNNIPVNESFRDDLVILTCILLLTILLPN